VSRFPLLSDGFRVRRCVIDKKDKKDRKIGDKAFPAGGGPPMPKNEAPYFFQKYFLPIFISFLSFLSTSQYPTETPPLPTEKTRDLRFFYLFCLAATRYSKKQKTGPFCFSGAGTTHSQCPLRSCEARYQDTPSPASSRKAGFPHEPRVGATPTGGFAEV
jgi:hypothetical protein